MKLNMKVSTCYDLEVRMAKGCHDEFSGVLGANETSTFADNTGFTLSVSLMKENAGVAKSYNPGDSGFNKLPVINEDE